MSGELDIEQSFNLLGIPPTSGAAEIKSAYHELSKKFHPDSPKGSEEQQATLNHAYENAIAYAKGGQLVVVEIKKAMQIVKKDIARQNASQEIATFSAETVRRRTTNTQRLKYAIFLFAGVAGILGFVANVPNIPSEAIVNLKILTVGLVAVGGFLQFIVQHQTYLIESLKERLGDENECVTELRRLGVTANQPFTLDNVLERAGLLRRVKLRNPDQLTLAELIELKHGRRNLDDGEMPIHPVARILIPLLKGSPFRLNKAQVAKMALLKADEHGILQIVAKRPRTYAVTSEFKGSFH